jgi:hypothetical protein
MIPYLQHSGHDSIMTGFVGAWRPPCYKDSSPWPADGFPFSADLEWTTSPQSSCLPLPICPSVRPQDACKWRQLGSVIWPLITRTSTLAQTLISVSFAKGSSRFATC